MSTSAFEDAFAKVTQLAATFKANESTYLSSDYHEAEVRKDFIDKFWTALGWDVNHDYQTNPYEQEVKVERSMTGGAAQRRADYAFCLAPNFRDPRFYVEAKKPYGDIATADNYFQTIRYGWNSQNAVAVLTDFEQFHILDCRHKPDIATALDKALAKYHCADYTDREKFAQIYWFFSREALATGSFDRRVDELPKPRGKAVRRKLFPGAYKPVDEAFLEDLDEFRTTLARTFKAENPRLDGDTLTELAQRTLDRLVFMRFLEDRGIEPGRLVDNFGATRPAWQDFVAASIRLDGVYNGVVFKHHDLLDSPTFRVDDEVFAGICERLASFNTPYDFNFIPIHILGSIYERFLGKVIVATEKRVRVENKPEVRKAGGVYYTREYIVRYIVEQTVGTEIAGKTPAEIAKMRFADIACGSGSFLLGVYDALIEHHGNYYNANPAKAKKAECIERVGKLYLSLAKKREILLNNIYGVDIDPQAVEVAQLSLYLRLLKEETPATLHQSQLEFTHDVRMKKLLPDLSKNIVCGNSLLGRDILEGQHFDDREERRLNTMDFSDAFPDIVRRGGFDAVVGNPPYGLVFDDTVKTYLEQHYPTFVRNNDNYAAFVQRAVSLTRPDGRFGYIIPNTFLLGPYFDDLKRFLLAETTVTQIVDFGLNLVFPAPNVFTALLFARRRARGRAAVDTRFARVSELDDFPAAMTVQVLDRRTLDSLRWAPTDPLVDRLLRHGPFLGDVAFVKDVGLNYWTKGRGKTRGGSIAERVLYEGERRNKHDRPYLKGRDIERYEIRFGGHWLRRDWRERLDPRVDTFRFSSEYLECEKIVYRQTADCIIAALETEGVLTDKTLHSVVIKDEWRDRLDPRYLLALLNSKLLNYLYRALAQEGGRLFAQVKTFRMKQLPVRVLDLHDRAASAVHVRLLSLVDQTIEGRRRLATAETDRDKAFYRGKAESAERQIDAIVYQHYGLTEREVRMIERSRD